MLARLMRQARLSGISRRKDFKTTVRDRDSCPAPDLVQRRFTADHADHLWVADIPYIPTLAGSLNLKPQTVHKSGITPYAALVAIDVA